MAAQVETQVGVRPRVLVVDADAALRAALERFLASEGCEVQGAESAGRCENLLASGRWQVVLCETHLPDAEGLELLRRVRAGHPEVEVILLTAYGRLEEAVEAIRRGAQDYLTKPVVDDDLRMSLRRAFDRQALAAENRRLKRALGDRFSFENVVGQDWRMGRVFELVEAVADTKATVLLTGESGTGKSLVAGVIHQHSPRRSGPFVEVACGALPEGLLESELFGHVRGAFTGAVSDKRGKFEAADGGTLFLDEVATASPALQVKLLRAIQERRFEPVGGVATDEVDVRLVLATNADLRAEVAAGRFREDLYYRVNVVNVELPPLRDRLADISLLATHFLRGATAETGRGLLGFSAEAMDRMQRYNWPGNVRELENCVERASIARGAYVEPEDLAPAVLEGTAPAARGASEEAGGGRAMTLAEALEVPEKRIIQSALGANEGNRTEAARQLGINRATLYRKMRRFGLLG